MILTDQGLFYSSDLYNWETRNLGLPQKAMKYIENVIKSFSTYIQDLKDLEKGSQNSNILVTTTPKAVF